MLVDALRQALQTATHGRRIMVIPTITISQRSGWNGLRAAGRCDFCHTDRHGNNLGGVAPGNGVGCLPLI